MEINVPFSLHAHCMIVKGVTRSTLSDLSKKKYHFIPNSLADLLQKYQGKSISEILADYHQSDHPILLNYFEFLVSNDLLIFDENITSFIPIDLKWESPSKITNAIIDFSSNRPDIDYSSIITQLSDLGCKAVMLRFYDVLDDPFLQILLKENSWNRIRDIQLVLPFKTLDPLFYGHVYNSNLRISSILVHSSPENKVLTSPGDQIYSVVFIKDRILNSSHCGVILPHYFSVNLDTYIEANSFNSCLNRKIGIDSEGNIKNCPAMPTIYGNVKTDRLEDAINKEGFKILGSVVKSEIDDCKVCEFRMMCTDCRIKKRR
jgi:SPASM domain peptide maturase of grasp-with-spasm system